MPCHQSFLRQQGVPGAEQGWHQRRPLLLPVISISDARLTYLQRLCKVLLARCFLRCVCFMLNLVTFSPLEGNLVPCEPRLIILETFRLYSRLFSCTRNLASSIWSSSVYYFVLWAQRSPPPPTHLRGQLPKFEKETAGLNSHSKPCNSGRSLRAVSLGWV